MFRVQGLGFRVGSSPRLVNQRPLTPGLLNHMAPNDVAGTICGRADIARLVIQRTLNPGLLNYVAMHF